MMNSTDKVKAIALALENYESVYKSFPAAYTVDKGGKPLLSWRVLILPYLEQDALYKKFRLNEPWDSEHNKKLISKMPPAFNCPVSKLRDTGKTNYLAVRGEKAVFPGNTSVSLEDIQDGPANTIMVVEVPDEKPVVWTQPEDFRYDEQNPLKGLVGLHPGLFIAGFADGHVEVMSDTIKPPTLKALFTRSGNEPLRADRDDW
jgi:prepilin-type processing-associated H-X9-DG protein